MCVFMYIDRTRQARQLCVSATYSWHFGHLNWVLCDDFTLENKEIPLHTYTLHESLSCVSSPTHPLLPSVILVGDVADV